MPFKMNFYLEGEEENSKFCKQEGVFSGQEKDFEFSVHTG